MAGKRHQTETGEVVTGLAKDIGTWINALEDQTERMSEWEVGFLISVADRFLNGDGNLTEKQIDRLREMYRKYY